MNFYLEQIGAFKGRTNEMPCLWHLHFIFRGPHTQPFYNLIFIYFILTAIVDHGLVLHQMMERDGFRSISNLFETKSTLSTKSK